jgi:hypothetical protein
MNRLHLDSEFTTEPCRHTDGMQARQSKRAIQDRYSSHFDPSMRCDHFCPEHSASA